ncbi:MAG: GntR family transcriptional regulator [Phycisphaerae bacterium]|nr:GntR family transcriptional regulator [Phycisphaerae bacterium]
MDTCTDTSYQSYESLTEELRRLISSSKVDVGELIGTEQGFVRQTGLSRKSVRKAIAVLVGEGLLERRPGKGVFVCHPGAATRTVQVIIPNIEFASSAQIARGAHTFGCSRGVQVQIYDAHVDATQAADVVKKLPASGMNGAIITSFHHPEFAEAICRLKMADFPVVLVDEQLEDVNIPSVVADNYAGGYAAGEHLLHAGHTRIGYVGPMQRRTVRHRAEGLRDAVLDAKRPFDRSLVRDTGPITPENLRAATHELLRRENPVSAIFFYCDVIAVQAYEYIEELGLAVGRDVSVVGFDNDPSGAYVRPNLTTVEQPWTRMGAAAMDMLLKQIQLPPAKRFEAGKPEELHKSFETRLISRDSVRGV